MRAVFITDVTSVVCHASNVKEISQLIDYDAVNTILEEITAQKG